MGRGESLMSPYVDGYVLPVPTDNIDEYREIASEAGRRWMEHGALRYVECVGDDLEPDMGDVEIATFPDLVATEPTETAIFAFVVFESREHRDEVNADVMEEMADAPDRDMPFDVTRMAYGGFDSIVEYESEPTGEPIGTAD